MSECNKNTHTKRTSCTHVLETNFPGVFKTRPRRHPCCSFPSAARCQPGGCQLPPGLRMTQESFLGDEWEMMVDKNNQTLEHHPVSVCGVNSRGKVPCRPHEAGSHPPNAEGYQAVRPTQGSAVRQPAPEQQAAGVRCGRSLQAGENTGEQWLLHVIVLIIPSV